MIRQAVLKNVPPAFTMGDPQNNDYPQKEDRCHE
jgi:hypothetical protein